MAESVRNLAGNPAVQPFNIKGKPNKAKRNSWWNHLSPSYWRNRATKKTKTALVNGD